MAALIWPTAKLFGNIRNQQPKIRQKPYFYIRFWGEAVHLQVYHKKYLYKRYCRYSVNEKDDFRIPLMI